MKPALPPVFAHVLDCLIEQSERYFGQAGIIVEPLVLADREAAQVLRVRLRIPGTSDRHVFVKLFKPRGPSPEAREFMRARVLKDFAVTSQIHEALREYSDLSAVRPVACFPDDLVLVTEEAPGEPLHVVLDRYATWQPDSRTLEHLTHVARRIGVWLKTFQEIERVNRRITLDDMREYLDVRLRRLAQNPKGRFSEEQRMAVLSYFDSKGRDVRAADLDEVSVHGDIAPSNILVNGEKIVVLDFAMACTGGMYFDVARLFTQLEFLKAKPKFRPQVVAKLQSAMLNGFNPSLCPDHPLFQLFELQHVICHIANLSLNPAPPVARLYNRYQLRRHHRWLRERAA
jgi:tRNA A-37 threonylcarbamoyl transferase component Bud32